MVRAKRSQSRVASREFGPGIGAFPRKEILFPNFRGAAVMDQESTWVEGPVLRFMLPQGRSSDCAHCAFSSVKKGIRKEWGMSPRMIGGVRRWYQQNVAKSRSPRPQWRRKGLRMEENPHKGAVLWARRPFFRLRSWFSRWIRVRAYELHSSSLEKKRLAKNRKCTVRVGPITTFECAFGFRIPVIAPEKICI